MLSLDSSQETKVQIATFGSEETVTVDEPGKSTPNSTAEIIESATTHAPQASLRNSSGQEVTALNRGWSDVDPLKWFSLTAAWSFCYSACVHPMYFATTHRQISNSTSTVSYWTSLRNQFRQYGIRGVYRGFLTLFVGASVSEWLYLGVLEVSRENMPISGEIYKDFISGALADVCSQIFYCPFGLIGNRQLAAGHCSSSYPYLPFHKSLSQTLRTEGLRGLWVGLAPSLFLVPSTGAWWSIYGETKRYLYAKHESLTYLYGSYASSLPESMTSATDNVVHNSVAGAFAGLCITGLVNPVWVMRARVQIMPECAERTMRHVVRDVWKQNGLRGFYRGAGMNATIYALESALFGTLYDYLKFSSQIE
ncbi:mitochondrial carrier protein [Perkinsela sp. CCAP 1560/4]|nr:mitochondrial carrier protein [Perkinsela sp. CCAP 1560/4]|eukprot:KNH06411.1 mitochondrial carrier protein [Perkinsela sp. CCAP 1560/4]